MIIELSNGLDHLFQWDSGQKIKISDGVPTVHFKWGNDAVSFEVVDGWVEIAPELTQKAGYILLWTYKEDHTLDAARIPVERRPKPADYVYTPTEIKTWESLDKRIKALEDGGGVAGVSSVNGQTGAVEITAKGLGALTEDDLQSATNAALAQAKASGEFDGAPGAPGTPGAPGADGYSPTVTVEQTDTGATITATDQDGTTTATIKNGSPGTTPHIGDNGNWYLGDTDTGKPSQGPAGAGLDVTGATVGQTVKISAVDDNGVPTAWVPVDMASGGGEKPLTLIADVVISGGEANTFEYTGLGGLTELYFVGRLSNGVINTALATTVNGTKVTTKSLPVEKTIKNETWNYWCAMQFNGEFWIVELSPEHAGADAQGALGSIGSPNSVVLGIEAAESLSLYVPNPAYKPTSGWFKLWGR